MRSWFPVLALVACALACAPPRCAAAASSAKRASELYSSAKSRLATRSHEQRQFARRELEEAALLAPTRADIALALGWLYLEGDLLARARDVANRIAAIDSAASDGWMLQGEVQRRTWLTMCEETDRDRAIVCFARSTRLAPRTLAGWRELVPLLVDADELESAHDAAVVAARLAPSDPEAQAMLASVAQRQGDLATADRLFRAAIPRLPEPLRERYDDVGPLLPPWSAEAFESLGRPEHERFVTRFWSDADPDPVSVENEAQLEFWSRVTQAAALFGTSRPGEWDMRAQYYVRFGRPSFQQLNPPGLPNRLGMTDWLAWTYPELGLRVWMGTPSSVTGYSEVISAWPLWAFAAPDSLERRGEIEGMARGWAVFHKLPPGVEPIPAALAMAHFQSDAGPIVLAQAEAPGGFEDRLRAKWAVLDTAFTAVARDERVMSASACRAGEAQSASFTSGLAPGRYRVGLEVEDGFGRRALVKRDLVVTAPGERLAMSDLVVTCSPPSQSVGGGSAVRLEPETGLFPAGGDQLNAYFEIYRLTPARNGDARFVYDCSVEPAGADPRGWLSRLVAPREEPPRIQVSRMETTHGALRRQFLSVPVGPLPPGRYQVSVLVRDLGSGEIARSTATFERTR